MIIPRPAIAFAFAVSVAAMIAPAFSRNSKPAPTPASEQLELCAGCPQFTPVPSPPGHLRPVRFVSTYELTWNNYLKAVDDRSCDLPGAYVGMSTFDPREVRDHLDRFRLDWPITQLRPQDIKCYIGWLQRRADYVVSLPSGKEWEWFAHAGHDDAKFPWGDSTEPGHEALAGTLIDRANERPLPYDQGGKYISGAKVGLFPPNAWGLYDVLGNVRELTSDEVSGPEWLRTHPDDAVAKGTKESSRTLVKGWSRSDVDWAKEGISANRYTFVSEDHFSSSVGVRLVLLSRPD